MLELESMEAPPEPVESDEMMVACSGDRLAL